MPKSYEENLEKEFHVSWYIIFYKFIFGVIEFVAGVGILALGTKAIGLYRIYLSHELLEDPNDLLANISGHIVPYIFSHRTYIVIYLIILGGAKIAGAIGLIYGKDWGVDLLVGLTVLMFPFQFIHFILQPTFIEFIYIVTGLLIALYLVNFRPRDWGKKIWKRLH